MTKIIACGKRYHFSLVEPGWPSKAYDCLIAGGGLNLALAGTPYKRQIDLAILSITRKCAYRCVHCYEHFNIATHESVPADLWRATIADLQEIGTNVIVLSGGEPLLRFDECLEILAAGDKDRSDFHLHTTGYSLDSAKTAALVDAGLAGAGIGLDDFDRVRLEKFRGHPDAFDNATAAVRLFSEAGVFTYVNMCPTPPMADLDKLWRVYRLIRDLGASALQILEPAACGALRDAGAERMLSPAGRDLVTKFFLSTYCGKWKRWPAVYYDAYLEDPRRLGCMMGGLSHLHIDGAGNVKPCVFLPVSFGSITREPFRDIYARMRSAIPFPVRTGCPTATLSGTLRRFKEYHDGKPVPREKIRQEWDAMFARS